MKARNLDAQLPPIAGVGQRNMAQVELYVEIGVFNPLGPVEAAGNFHQARAEQGVLAKAAFEGRDNLFEAHESARCRRWVINAHTANMLRRICLFEIEKSRI